jgi:hypothetical protein
VADTVAVAVVVKLAWRRILTDSLITANVLVRAVLVGAALRIGFGGALLCTRPRVADFPLGASIIGGTLINDVLMSLAGLASSFSAADLLSLAILIRIALNALPLAHALAATDKYAE